MADMLIILLFALSGLIGGSFLTVVVTRGPIAWGLVEPTTDMPSQFGLAVPRSHCPHCKAPVTLPWLLPGLGFFLAQGKCRTCSTPIPRLYPLLEGISLVLGILAAVTFPSWQESAVFLLFSLSMLALSVIDWRTGFLPDAITLPLIAIGLALSFIPIFVSWPAALSGAVLGYGVFWSLRQLFQMIRGYEGLGLGDAKLLAGIGTFAGATALPFVVLIASSLALSVHIALALTGGKALSGQSEIRFGPYLAGASILVLMIKGVFTLD